MGIFHAQIAKNSFISLASGAAIGALLSESWEGAAIGALANLSVVQDQRTTTLAKVTAIFAAAKLGCILLNTSKTMPYLVGLACIATMDRCTRTKIALTAACVLLHTENYCTGLFYQILCGKVLVELEQMWLHTHRDVHFHSSIAADLLFLPIGFFCKQTWLFTAVLINNVWQYKATILGIFCGFRELRQCYRIPSQVVDSVELFRRGRRVDAIHQVFLSLSRLFIWNRLSSILTNRAFDSGLPLILKVVLVLGTNSYATMTLINRLPDIPPPPEKPHASEAEIAQLRRHIAQLERSQEPDAKKFLAAAQSRLANLTSATED